MHLACRHGSLQNSLKLVRPRKLWPCHPVRSFSTSSSLQQNDVWQASALGTYTPNSSPNHHARNIAILGGGISGLATAFNLTKDIPSAKITIFEQQEKLGGWVDSEHIDVDDGTVLFEWGPRSLRSDLGGSGRATLQLLNRLSGEDSVGDAAKAIRGIPNDQPSATNRYLYYPDHLVCMPNPKRGIFSNLYTLLSEPIFSGVFSKLFAETWVAERSSNTRDESVGSFISRRYGALVADNLVSALYHGIYAGDIYNLSARTLMPRFWYLEKRDTADGHGINIELLELITKSRSLLSFDTVRLMNRMIKDDSGNKESFAFLQRQMSKTSIYSFVRGLGQLNDFLLDYLKSNTNVTLRPNTKVEKLEFDSSNRKFSVSTSSQPSSSKEFDYTICTLSPAVLAQFLQPSEKADTTKSVPSTSLISSLENGCPKSVNVMVVNLYYQNPNLPIPRGFGYLIPRSVPVEQNPERALGVIFASETTGPRGPKDAFVEIVDLPKQQKEGEEDPELDPDSLRRLMEQGTKQRIQVGQDTASGTKLAVMIGGHWWSGWKEEDLPDEQTAIEMAKSVIQRHLKVTEEPMLAKARLQREAIPQYQVGYRDAMARIHQNLVKDYEGRIKVLGPWWQGGVGVNDCVKSARETSRRIREAWDDQTGLEDYVGEEKWVLVDRRTNVQVLDPLQVR
ncbi:oxygen-dependent protoporphyrinogen oxidase [Lithohypha guttulata]|uniref:oxygen-dependent protoporphyrinogen oxidase n=1 Tax=Lithohypha guttulata TaxID=1690604 RepID=UPI002DE0EC2C|nr:oxygen-dependent protoporphyrinogen oxidase [Lithohypha guttulata]